jgi:hypothetical protein
MFCETHERSGDCRIFFCARMRRLTSLGFYLGLDRVCLGSRGAIINGGVAFVGAVGAFYGDLEIGRRVSREGFHWVRFLAAGASKRGILLGNSAKCAILGRYRGARHVS